jgi:hypothetical protein
MNLIPYFDFSGLKYVLYSGLNTVSAVMDSDWPQAAASRWSLTSLLRWLSLRAPVDGWHASGLALCCFLPWLVHATYRTYVQTSGVDDSARRAGLHSRRAAVEQGAQAMLLVLLALCAVAHTRGVAVLLAPSPGLVALHLLTMVRVVQQETQR